MLGRRCSHHADRGKKVSWNAKQVRKLGDQLGINWNKVDLDQLTAGMKVELEHRDITGGDPELTARIALAHLAEFPDYYTRLEAMEAKAHRDWSR